MEVIILEDETRAANDTERLFQKVAPEMKVVAKLETVRDADVFLKTHSEIDLIFSDVPLTDGLSFEIFGQVQIKCPIIFTTAYHPATVES